MFLILGMKHIIHGEVTNYRLSKVHHQTSM